MVNFLGEHSYFLLMSADLFSELFDLILLVSDLLSDFGHAVPVKLL